MKLLKMITGNIDKIYNAVKIGHNDRTVQRNVSVKARNLMSHVSVIMELEDVNIFEAYLLKIYTAGRIYILETYMEPQNIEVNNGYTATLKTHCEKLMDILSGIDHDTDIPIKPDGVLAPCLMVKKKVRIELTSDVLFNIFTAIPDFIFSKTFGLNLTEMLENMTDAIPDTEMQKFIWELFYDSFYKMAKSILDQTDIVTETFITSEYYKYVDSTGNFIPARMAYVPWAQEPIEIIGRNAESKTEDIIALTDVTTAAGMMHFLGKDAQNIQQELQACKEISNTISKDDIFTSTRLNFVINAPFYVFLEMAIALPNSFIIDHESFTLVNDLITGLYYQPELKGYTLRLGNWLDEFLGHIITVKENCEGNIKKYWFTPLNTKIAFNLSVSLEDISYTLQNYKRQIDNGLYGDMNTVLKDFILRILGHIQDMSIRIYKTLM